jgi:hypothetical protein
MTVAAPSGVVTFLFTDVEGSTRRWEKDADGMRVALAARDLRVRPNRPGPGKTERSLERDDIRESDNVASEMARRYYETPLTSGDTILLWAARATVVVD